MPFNNIPLLGVFLLVHNCLFTIDCASHVRPDQHFPVPSLPKSGADELMLALLFGIKTRLLL